MKVYLPVDICGLSSLNPYLNELVRGLEHAGCQVDIGKYRLLNLYKAWDIVHFHWPEYILDSYTPSAQEIDWLRLQLDAIKKTSRIVVTVHNASPHFTNSRDYEPLYRTLYKYADGFIHMGPCSENILKQTFPKECSGKLHTVIPHGNYAVMGLPIEKEKARAMYNLEPPWIALVIGAIRSQDELDLILDSMPYWADKDHQLLLAGHWSIQKPAFRLNYLLKQRLTIEINEFKTERRIKRTRNLIFRRGPIPQNQMATLLSTADVLLIPRKRLLNSGNLALGFTYGKVVVGPDVGNVGELLRRHGNPTFDPSNGPQAVANAINEGFEAAQRGLGEHNANIAKDQWSWEQIGQQHQTFYETVLNFRRDNVFSASR